MLSSPIIFRTHCTSTVYLGPLLFLVFVNDIVLTLKLCYLKMLTDYSIIHTHGDSIEELNFKLNNDVKSINDWCNQNRMALI